MARSSTTHPKAGRRGAPSLAAVLAAVLTVAGLSAVTAAPASADPPTGGSTIVDETFEGAFAADPAWKPLGTACLTGTPSGTAPPAGAAQIPSCIDSDYGPVPPMGVQPGYLQLTDALSNQSGSLLYNKPLPATSGISVTFDQYQYGGTGADGIGFFLVDGSTNLTQPGGKGGSLGYAPLLTTPGVVGGYIGVGLDAFGNYYADSEGRGGGCPAGQKSPSTNAGQVAPHVVTVRGPGEGVTGYCYLDATVPKPITSPNHPGTSLNGGTGTLSAATLDASKRTINIQVTPITAVDPIPRVIVQIRYTDAGPWVTELDIAAPPNTPSTYKFGFSASTGGQRDVHLIRQARVETIVPLASLQLEKQVDRTAAPLPPVIIAGTVIPYQYTVTNTGVPVDDLQIADDKIATSAIVCDRTSLTTAPDPGSSTVCRGSYTVTAADVTAGHVVNVAHADAVPTSGGTVASPEATVTIPLVASIALTKAVTTPPPYSIGQTVSYSYGLQNTGAAILHTITMTDDRIPTSRITCLAGLLGPGESTTCTGTYVVEGAHVDAAGFVVNTARVSALTPIGQTATAGPVTAQIPVGTDVAVTKSVDVAEPLVGQDVTFTVSATGNGPATATGVVITDLLPSGDPADNVVFKSATASQGTYSATTGQWSLGELAPGDSATLQIVATVHTNTPFTNTATRTATTQPDRDPTNDSASATVNAVLPSMDIVVTKSVDVGQIPLGATATFTLGAKNNGPQAASGVQVTDVLPAGLTFVADAPGDPDDDGAYDPATGLWTIGDLAAGQTATRTITVVGAALGSFTNLAALTGSPAPPDSNAGNNSAMASLSVVRPESDLAIAKSAFPPIVVVGDVVTYDLEASNLGPDTAQGVVVRDVFPAGVTVLSATATVGTISADGSVWTIGTLAPGQTGVVATVTGRVDVTGTLVNTAAIASPVVDDPDTSNNASSATVTSDAPQLDIAVAKSVTVPSGAPADAVPVGEQVAFTLTARNIPGPTDADATDVVLSDLLPDGLAFVSDSGDGSYDSTTGLWSLDSITTGATATHTIVATVTAPSAFVNTVSLVSLAEADTDPSNNSASVGVAGLVFADLAIEESVIPPIIRPGDEATVMVTVTNEGPHDATGVSAFPPMAPGARIVSSSATIGTFDDGRQVWEIGDLAVGQSAVLTVVITVEQPGWMRNAVVVLSADQPDPDLSDNATAGELYAPAADVAVVKTVENADVYVGDTVTLTVDLWNYGPDSSGRLVVSDLLPAGLTFVSATPSTGTYDPVAGEWVVPNLPPANLAGSTRAEPGPQETLQIVARASAAGAFTSAATAVRGETDVFDPDHANNTDAAVVTASPEPAELHVVKTADPASVVAGATVAYTMTVSNAGPAAAEDVVLSDVFPDGVTPTGTETPGCAIEGMTLTCDLGALAVDETVTVTVSATVARAGTFLNTVAVSSSTPLAPASTLTADATVVASAPPASAAGGGGSTLPATGGAGAGAGPLAAMVLTMTGVLFVLWSRRRRGVSRG